ncbi:MAG: hypothetical protein BAJALOKI3v1_140057 [Promethearchaeota archaeon]|nr:MAG: hypothetical protein BAJALOKI3v1_140057 [Candidatus Lokiarchaeota archaeon]
MHNLYFLNLMVNLVSIEKLEKQVEDLMEQRDELEENCDTLPQCKDENGCSSCDIYTKIEKIDNKIEEIEEQIEKIMSEDE